MISCVNEETLQAYFDGELQPAAAAAVVKHLAECDACADRGYELERAIELMASAFEAELPESVPTEHLRARIEAALARQSAAVETASAAPSFWQHLLDGLTARLNWLALSPRQLAYAGLGVIALVFALWFVIDTGILLPKNGKIALRDKKEVQPSNQGDQKQPGKIQPKPFGEQAPDSRGLKQPDAVASNESGKRIQRPRPKVETRLKEQEARAEILANAGDPLPEANAGMFGAEITRHFEKAQVLLRSFKNADPAAKDFASELAHEKRQSRSLLYQNILLRRNAETSGNLPAEEVLSSLEPVLLDIANLPDRPSPDDLRPVKERLQKNGIIGALQVYSAPLVAANY
jgi:hypothetical protein